MNNELSNELISEPSKDMNTRRLIRRCLLSSLVAWQTSAPAIHAAPAPAPPATVAPAEPAGAGARTESPGTGTRAEPNGGDAAPAVQDPRAKAPPAERPDPKVPAANTSSANKPGAVAKGARKRASPEIFFPSEQVPADRPIALPADI